MRDTIPSPEDTVITDREQQSIDYIKRNGLSVINVDKAYEADPVTIGLVTDVIEGTDATREVTSIYKSVDNKTFLMVDSFGAFVTARLRLTQEEKDFVKSERTKVGGHLENKTILDFSNGKRPSKIYCKKVEDEEGREIMNYVSFNVF